MSINSAVGVGSTASLTGTTSDKTSQTNTNNSLGENAFLQLLTTQLSNQDPLSPQDDTQFLAQLAQFSTVEGITNLESSQSQQKAANLLGKTVNAVVTTATSSTPVSGQVVSVSWDKSGVNVTLNDANNTTVSLANVQQISDTPTSRGN